MMTTSNIKMTIVRGICRLQQHRFRPHFLFVAYRHLPAGRYHSALRKSSSLGKTHSLFLGFDLSLLVLFLRSAREVTND